MRVTAAVAAAALLAGCGGGDKAEQAPAAKQTATATATQATETMSAATWSARVTAICKQTEAKAKQDGEKIGREAAASGASKAELTRKLMEYVSAELPRIQDRIDALPKPQGKEQQAGQFSKEMRRSATVAHDTAVAIEENDDQKGRTAVAALLVSVKTARQLARSLDIAQCNPAAGAGFG